MVGLGGLFFTGAGDEQHFTRPGFEGLNDSSHVALEGLYSFIACMLRVMVPVIQYMGEN